MDADGDGKVTKAERRAFRQQVPENVAGKWGLSYALISQLRNSTDADANRMYDWFQTKLQEYRDNPTGFSDDAFVIEFNSQPWAQKYKSDAIKDMDFEAQFPDLYKQQVQADIETLRDQVIQYGVDITDEELRDLAVQKRRFGMTEAQLNNTLAELATSKSGDFRGETMQTQQNLKDWAYRNGIGLSDNIINDYVRKIRAGDTTEADVLQDLRRTYLAGAYPAWSDKIISGYDPADIFAPHLKNAQDLLEDGNIDLNDPVMKQITQAVGQDGKPYAMPLYEAERVIRSDPRWPKTDNAYSIYTDVGTKLLQTFGFR
jgi:hypothetical protein